MSAILEPGLIFIPHTAGRVLKFGLSIWSPNLKLKNTRLVGVAIHVAAEKNVSLHTMRVTLCQVEISPAVLAHLVFTIESSIGTLQGPMKDLASSVYPVTLQNAEWNVGVSFLNSALWPTCFPFRWRRTGRRGRRPPCRRRAYPWRWWPRPCQTKGQGTQVWWDLEADFNVRRLTSFPRVLIWWQLPRWASTFCFKRARI